MYLSADVIGAVGKNADQGGRAWVAA